MTKKPSAVYRLSEERQKEIAPGLQEDLKKIFFEMKKEVEQGFGELFPGWLPEYWAVRKGMLHKGSYDEFKDRFPARF